MKKEQPQTPRRDTGKGKRDEPNLGQKEAQLEKKSKCDLKHMDAAESCDLKYGRCRVYTIMKKLLSGIAVLALLTATVPA
jgi:hypothetical protein